MRRMTNPSRRRWFAGRYRKSGALPSGSRDDASSLPTSSPGHFGDGLIKPQPRRLTWSENCNC